MNSLSYRILMTKEPEGGYTVTVPMQFQSTISRWMPLRFAPYVQRVYDTWSP